MTQFGKIGKWHYLFTKQTITHLQTIRRKILEDTRMDVSTIDGQIEEKKPDTHSHNILNK